MIPRMLERQIPGRLGDGKAILVQGARQTGKTTLIRNLLAGREKVLALTGDEALTRQLLTDPDLARLRGLLGGQAVLFLDEAQRIPNIGLTLKLLVDHFPDLQILVTGSSSLELADHVHEPLTGRKWDFPLFPICWQELEEHVGAFDARRQLEQRLVYGMYPEVVSRPGFERDLLTQLSGESLTRDLLAYEGLRKPELLGRLLQTLALQVGHEVSTNELAGLLQAGRGTINSYLDLLEKAYVVFTLPPFLRNRRDEIRSTRKVYFWDNGIRNALLGSFQPLDLRTDTGALWENFLVSERRKLLAYQRVPTRLCFWRTHSGAEVDLVEERDGRLTAWEFKWSPSKRAPCPVAFRESYPDATFQVLHRDSFRDFLVEDAPAR
ncbi:MAG: ATP-binding protein [Candidatus Delongbacteria bacterium]